MEFGAYNSDSVSSPGHNSGNSDGVSMSEQSHESPAMEGDSDYNLDDQQKEDIDDEEEGEDEEDEDEGKLLMPLPSALAIFFVSKKRNNSLMKIKIWLAKNQFYEVKNVFSLAKLYFL